MSTTSELDPSAAGADASEANWAEVGRYPSEGDGFEHGLVVLAMGLTYWLREEPEGRGYRLLVPAEEADAVLGQLEIFDRESVAWPPAPRREAVPRKWREALFLSLFWALGAMGVFAAQLRWPELTEAAAMDARAVFAEGEWWRPATALFLHADPGHLVSNLAGGVFLFAAVFSVWGRRRGAVLLGASAIAANAAVGGVYFPNEYRSLGASTALFAALGLLTGRAVRGAVSGAGAKTRTGAGGWRGGWVPLWAGATMLMLFGAGEMPVDVPAHAAGFVVGVLVGVVFADSLGPPDDRGA